MTTKRPYKRLARKKITKKKFQPWQIIALVGFVAFVGVVFVLISRAATGLEKIQSSKEIGFIPKPANIISRDGGSTALIGGKIYYMFADTLYHTSDGSALKPEGWRSATMATADFAKPFTLEENMAQNGAPVQFIPYTAEELAYNIASKDPIHNRIALWPTSVVATSESTGLVYFQKFLVKDSLNYQSLGVGVAEFRLGDKVATRAQNLLFSSDQTAYIYAVTDESFVYVYGCKRLPNQLQGPCKVVRVLTTRAKEASAYQAWNGNSWVASLDLAAEVFTGDQVGLSIGWNPYLKKYTAVYMRPFSNQISFRYADRPEGPWGDIKDQISTVVGSTPTDPTTDVASLDRAVSVQTSYKTSQLQKDKTYNYSSRLHQEMTNYLGNRIILSYYSPGTGSHGRFVVLHINYANNVQNQPITKTVSVLPMGDSITVGYPAYQGGYRTWLWREAIGYGTSLDFVGPFHDGPVGFLGDLAHAGIAGSTTESYLAYLKTSQVARTYSAQKALLMLGSNDMSSNDVHSQPAFANSAVDRMRQIILEVHAQSPNTQILVSTIPPRPNSDEVNKRTQKYNTDLAKLVNSLNTSGLPVTLIDAGGQLPAKDMGLFGLHPNVSGFTALADGWWTDLSK